MSSVASPAQSWTIEAVLRWAADDFRARGVDSPRLDAELLLSLALTSTRIQLIVDSKRQLEPTELARFRDLVKRRRAREPIAYILGQREFFGRSFRVDRRVLVPRPDTEVLVTAALARTRHLSMSMRAVDLCTGSGCVAITLGRERPTSQIVGVDLSADALEVARENVLRIGAYNVSLREGDLFAGVAASSRFDLVTANAPYIPSAEVTTLEPESRDFEPRLALDGGADGLGLIRRIVDDAPSFLRPAGTLALEVGMGEAPDVARLMTRAFGAIETHRDYAGIERVVSGVLERG